MGSTTIHPFPELRVYAEEEARAFAEACADAFALHMGDDTPAMYELGWDGMHDDEQEALTAAHLTLLCDLSRPASRDAVARLVAARVGTDLAGVHQRLALPGFPLLRLYDYCGVPDTAQGNGEHAPAEALALIVRHLWPEDSTDAR